MSIGGILGAVGGGLSAIPIVGQALGAVVSVAGAATDAGMQARQKKRQEEELKRQQQAEMLQQLTMPQQQGAERPEAVQLDNPNATPQQPPKNNVFSPSGGELGGYQLQMDQGIANMIIGEDRSLLGGP